MNKCPPCHCKETGYAHTPGVIALVRRSLNLGTQLVHRSLGEGGSVTDGEGGRTDLSDVQASDKSRHAREADVNIIHWIATRISLSRHALAMTMLWNNISITIN